jgi:hypothetical protein
MLKHTPPINSIDDYSPLIQHNLESIAENIWIKLRDSKNNKIASLDFDEVVIQTRSIVENELAQKGAIADYRSALLGQKPSYPDDFHRHAVMFALIYVQLSLARLNEDKLEEAWAHITRASKHLGAVEVLEDMALAQESERERKALLSRAGESNEQSKNSKLIKVKAIEIMAQGVPKDSRKQLGARMYLANELIPFLKAQFIYDMGPMGKIQGEPGGF